MTYVVKTFQEIKEEYERLVDKIRARYEAGQMGRFFKESPQKESQKTSPVVTSQVLVRVNNPALHFISPSLLM